MMAAFVFEPFLFFPLNFRWAFFFSSIAAWVKCGCVDLCVCYISMCPLFYPVRVRRTTFGGTSNDSFQRHWLFDLFLPSLTVVVAGLFSVFHVVVSFLYSCTFGLVFLLAGRFTFSLAVFLFCLPVLQRRYFITGAVIFILASLLHVHHSGVFNMYLCAVMMRFLYNKLTML